MTSKLQRAVYMESAYLKLNHTEFMSPNINRWELGCCIIKCDTSYLQVNQRMSIVGLIAFSVYQLVFTWPRRHALLLEPMKSTGITAPGLAALHAGFGGKALWD